MTETAPPEAGDRPIRITFTDNSSQPWWDKLSGVRHEPWMARLALAGSLTPEILALTALSGGGGGGGASNAHGTGTLAAFERSGLVMAKEADKAESTAALRDWVRRSMLVELEHSGADLAQVRAELIRAAEDYLATSAKDDVVLTQMCAWAEQNGEWRVLEQVWLTYNMSAFLGNAPLVECFSRVPIEARTQFPALSQAFAAVVALAGPTPFDMDAMLRTLVHEGRLHAEWARHTDLDDAVRAGSLWMESLGAFRSAREGSAAEDPWKVHEAIEARITAATSKGASLSTVVEAAYRGFSALIGVSTGRMAEARREAELALMIAEENSIGVPLAAWSLAMASHWLGDPKGAERGEAILDQVRSAGGVWWQVAAPLAPVVDLLRAIRTLDEAAAAAARAEVRKVQSFVRWFNLWLVELWAVAEYGLLWAGPELALNDFDAAVRLQEHPRPAYTREILLRLRAELLLNAGQVTRARGLLEGQEGFELLIPPRARMLLCLGKWSDAVNVANAGCGSPRVMFSDRAQLVAIRAGALLQSGAPADEIDQALALGCEMCAQLGTALPFALLPKEITRRLLERHREHLGEPSCGLTGLASQERLNVLKQGYVYLAEPPNLTRREQSLLPLLADSKTAEEIAQELFLSVNTVRKQVATLRGKFNARSRAELVAAAKRMGYLKP